MGPESRKQRGITFEQVRVAVDQLTEAGLPISAGSIREKLGNTGSNSTICKHLALLRSEQGSPGQVDAQGVSEHLVQMLAKEVARVSGERTAKLQERLDESQRSISSLVEENERLEEALTESRNLLGDAMRSLAEQSGIERELRAQLLDVGLKLDTAKADTDAHRSRAAVLEERLSLKEDHHARSECAREALAREVDILRQQVTTLAAEAAAAKSDARALGVELSSKQEVETSLDKYRTLASELQRELDSTRQQLAAVAAERAALGERVSEYRDALARSEAQVQKLLGGVLAGTTSAVSTRS